MARYRPETLKDGWNVVDGEEIFYISNPGLGLWAYRGRFRELSRRRRSAGVCGLRWSRCGMLGRLKWFDQSGD